MRAGDVIVTLTPGNGSPSMSATAPSSVPVCESWPNPRDKINKSAEMKTKDFLNT
jgi:hypothetical protein